MTDIDPHHVKAGTIREVMLSHASAAPAKRGADPGDIARAIVGKDEKKWRQLMKPIKDEAVRMAQDAIGLMLEDCKVCPEPSVPSALHVDPEDFVVMVPFDMEEYEKRYRPVKKTLSIPGWLNDAAESAHINFSGVLQDALKEKLHLA